MENSYRSGLIRPIVVYSYGFLFNCSTVGQVSDSMTTLALNFHRWVNAWCLSLALPTVAQLEVFFSSDCGLKAHFLCSIRSMLIDLIVN